MEVVSGLLAKLFHEANKFPNSFYIMHEDLG